MSTDHDLPTPFRAVVRERGRSAPHSAAEDSGSEESAIRAPHSEFLLESGEEKLDDEWSAEAIEEAYLRALEAADIDELREPADAAVDDVEFLDEDTSGEFAATVHQELSSDEPEIASADDSLVGSYEEEATDSESPRATLQQIVEAILFVGGEPLTTKRLGEFLGDLPTGQIDEAIESLNVMYTAEQRPYEIRLGEGGYRMALRLPYEKVRHRVFGIGPKEVKLSQDALEMLAFIAYRQPVTEEQFAETEKKNAKSLVRQLLQRELVLLDREHEVTSEQGAKVEPAYRTTSRFLQLFGLGSLQDLPRAEMVSFR